MISFYFDDDSGSRRVMHGLERIGITVVRTIEAGTGGWQDSEHLVYATEQGHVLVSANGRDFLRLHREFMEAGRHHAGIVIADQRLGIGERIRRLERLSTALPGDQMRDRCEFLSDWGET